MINMVMQVPIRILVDDLVAVKVDLVDLLVDSMISSILSLEGAGELVQEIIMPLVKDPIYNTEFT